MLYASLRRLSIFLKTASNGITGSRFLLSQLHSSTTSSQNETIMITIHELKQAIITCKKFSDLTQNLDIIKMANIPPMDFSNLSDDEKLEILNWTQNDSITVPHIIRNYIIRCSKD